jgi:hypothetical protein
MTVQVTLGSDCVDLAITQTPIRQTTEGAATLAAEKAGDRDEKEFGQPGNPALVGAVAKKSLCVVALRTVSGVGDLVVVVAGDVLGDCDGNGNDELHPATLQTQRLPKSLEMHTPYSVLTLDSDSPARSPNPA